MGGAATKIDHSSRIEASTVRRNLQYGISGLSSLSGVWGGAPVVKGFWEIFDQMSFSSTVYHVSSSANSQISWGQQVYFIVSKYNIP